MAIEFLLERFQANKDNPAIIWQDKIINYSQLLNYYYEASTFLKQEGVNSGEVISLTGDFTPRSISILLALIGNGNIIVPLNAPLKESEQIKFDIAEVEKCIEVNLETDQHTMSVRSVVASHPYFQRLREFHKSGLVLFTSGTSGFPKGAVHDFARLLDKFRTTRKSLRTINFLLFDHWGGLNTLFHTLSNCGVVLALRNRKPESVCEFIERYKIELLPASPSFLNLLLLSGVYRNYDLSSLSLITYGTEPMPENTLRLARKVFPGISFQQTYGLIELGVLRSKSKDDNSLWVKLGGEGYDLRVVDNILQIKAKSAMLGYLNAPSPFTEDGYFITGDEVLVDGDYYRILGRKSEIINVGGDKVYPQEVENIILGMENVIEVTVYGEKHIMMGNIVCAKVVLKDEEDSKAFTRRMRTYLKDKVQSFKVPVKVFVENDSLINDRYKKIRKF